MKLKPGVESLIERTLIEHSAFEVAMRRIRQCVNYSEGPLEPICIAVIGEARTGKSRLLEETEALSPRRRTADGLIVEILRLKVPSNPSANNLAEKMLKQLGDPKWNRGTESEKTGRLHDLLGACKVRVVLLDEFQHFLDKGRQVVFTFASEWLKTLVDETKVSLVVTGLESSLPILLQNEQLTGRFLAPVRLPRFDWTIADSRDEFIGILDSFADELKGVFEIPDIAEETMAFRFWCATGGLIGYLTKLLRQLVWNACDGKKKVLTIADFKMAYEESVWVEPGRLEQWHPFDNPELAPSPDLMAAVMSVGVKKELEPQPRRRRTGPAPEPSLNSVMRKSGGNA